MHELQICLNIIRECERQAASQDFVLVKKLSLEIGELSGIEINALTFSFPIAAKNTIVESAKLELIIIEGLAHCANCQDNVKIQTQFSPCPKCSGYDYKIIEGQQLKIKNMVVS